jgi:hypothetical protein
MKIKRFDNLWLMGLILSASILGVVYIIKLFFPNFIVGVAHLESITRIGHYIDCHKWAWYLASSILSFFIYYFYCCACCKRKSLYTKEIIIIIATILALFVVREFIPTQYTSLNISTMVLIPFIMKAEFKSTTICFVFCNFVQTISGEIRGIMAMVSNFNFATLIILMIDYYILIILLYFYFNFKEKEI